MQLLFQRIRNVEWKRNMGCKNHKLAFTLANRYIYGIE